MSEPLVDVMVQVVLDSMGLPQPTEIEFAQRLLEQLGRRGYEIRRIARTTADAPEHPCSCPASCIRHPFGPRPARHHILPDSAPPYPIHRVVIDEAHRLPRT